MLRMVVQLQGTPLPTHCRFCANTARGRSRQLHSLAALDARLTGSRTAAAPYSASSRPPRESTGAAAGNRRKTSQDFWSVSPTRLTLQINCTIQFVAYIFG